MLLASLALALFAFPQSSVKESVKEPKAEETPKVWDNLGVMRRMLTRQIGARRDKISSNPAPKSADGDEVRTDNGRVVDGYGGSVAKAYTEARDYTVFDGSVNADSEYVPGLAAIFSLTVPVKVQLVESEPAKDEAHKPAETKNADDEAWDKLARGDETSSTATLRFLSVGKGGQARNEPQRELRYDDAAVKALKETLFDTLARFGSRLGCAHGERIVVVARLTAGSVVNLPPAKGGDASEVKGAGDYDVWRSGRIGPAGTLLHAFSASTTNSTRRIVIQVSADDVRAFKNGDLDRDELLKKTRIDEFNSAATPGLNSFMPTWGETK